MTKPGSGEQTAKIHLEFDLLRNAQDSLKNAVHVLAWPDGPESEKLKHAILSVWHSAELLLKERVRRINPGYIYQNRRGGSTNVRTITSDQAIFLLESIGNIAIDPKDKQALEKCRNIRNQIEHNEFSITQKEARMAVGKMLSFIFTFGSEQLACNLEDEFKSDDTWKMLLNELYEFTDEYGTYRCVLDGIGQARFMLTKIDPFAVCTIVLNAN